MGGGLPRVHSEISQRSSTTRERTRKHRWDLRALGIGLLCACACFCVLFSSPLPFLATSIALQRIPESVCDAHLANGEHHSGFNETPVDSTVLMLYTPTSRASSFCYSDGYGDVNASVEREFLRVSAAYVSSPYAKPSSPYYDFFSAHNATLWTVDRVTRVAAPMRLDVVYTYVNPSAPSFEQQLKMRNVPFEPRRYRDWEELRYSLRSIRAFMLDNDALAQHHRRHAADVRRLGELGYRVNASEAEDGGVVPLVRRVYLVVSAADQVPAWLDVEKFAQLRVVTHRDMFTAEEAAWVLPTLNSNVIESGLHRIPDISRFFFYIANDMLVGRRVSFFDLFRPLSPLRQRLHLYDLSAHTGDISAVLSDGPRNIDRAALLLEPVVHSDTEVLKWNEGSMTAAAAAATWRARGELGSCFFQKARATLRQNAHRWRWSKDSILQPAWSTTKGFALRDPRYGTTPRGSGVKSGYYYYLTSTHLDGVDLPFGYAHIPQLVDRDVYRRLNEVELFDLTNVTRKAYEREMHPYSPIDEYAVFAVAMARGAERHIWNTVWDHAAVMAFSDVREELQSWWSHLVGRDPATVVKILERRLTHGAEASMFGALYGNTWGAQLQRPDLALEMGYWWVRGTVSPVRPSRRLSSLKALYAIPGVASGEMCRAGSPEWSARGDDQYLSLLLDMHHHTKHDDTFLFEMVDGDVKAMLLSARLMYEWVDRPLFMGFNDNFPYHADANETKAAFNLLLRIVSHNCAPAPWERMEVG
ncbi:hypothetical protein ABL78_7929 [Leptomonas seymouri]|uniref:Stealth protein CR2 conserved region 2 domain-containing protein n=1 Tax=Leptomonas seymouri TaxID=5684 RepID=A0A0N1HYV0_LEPSE|nr:hypothetical protein ABL78_7929 [Leptomonas seymouri]|eukprot:KPI83050.1 hypothetical protein ABL78_7929 [Leptomonas seymouri]